ncbi:MAG: PAS domain S-box protein, partial [Anaerolineales bacterium]
MTTTNKKIKGNGKKPAVSSTPASLPAAGTEEQNFQTILEAVGAPIVISRLADSEILYANRALGQIENLTAEEMVGRRTVDYFGSPEDRDKVAANLQQDGHVDDFEVLLRRGDGRPYWALLSARIINYQGETCVLSSYVDITERKRAEEAGKDERQRFQTILETIRIPTIISRLSDGQVVYANQAIAEISQVSRENLREFKTLNFYANPGDQEKIREALRTAGHVDDFEVQFRRADGTLYWGLLSSRIVNYEGETCVLSSYVDITGRKQVEQALHDSEARYSAVVTQATDGVVIIQDNILQFVNEAMGNMMGYAAAEMVNTPIINHIAPESRELIVNRIKARLAGQEVPTIYEARLQRKDGTLIDCELSAGVIEYRGKPADVGMIRDITERKRAEEALHESEDRFRRFTEVTGEGLVFHEQGKIIDANPAGLAMFGLTESSNFIGRNLLEFVLPEFHRSIVEKMQLQDVSPYEVQCIRADHSTFPVETSTRTYQRGDRTIRATSIRDITERKRVEEVLRAHDEFSQKQSAVFAELTRSETLYSGDIQSAFAEVTEAAAKTLNIQRSSIWYYNEDRTEIRCMDLYEEGKGHSAGIVLGKADFPAYFKALEDEKVIAAENAHTDPATHE